MLLQNPLAVITPTLDAQVLRVLASVEEAAFTGRQVARLIPEASQKGVSNVLGRLEMQGIVTMQQVGSAHHYRLNDRHLAAPHVRALVRLKAALHDQIQDAVRPWSPQPHLVAIFGSAARDEMTEDSDLDLFIVRPDTTPSGDPQWEQQTTALAADVTAWTGNDTRVLQMARATMLESVARDDRVLRDIARDGIVLVGDRSLLQGPRP